MDKLSKEYVISFFNSQLELYGDTYEALRWTEKGQIRHYSSMLDIAPSIDGARILDYGCGKGDFYQFLLDKRIEVDYTGMDINENFIHLATEKFPGVPFRVFDIEMEDLSDTFDYIFLCGVFNLKVDGLNDTVKNVLTRLFPYCREGMAFNALSDHTPLKSFELTYQSPEEIFRFAAKNLSPYLAIRHDRIDYDFTLFIYKALNPSL